jgi:hypothetical protein
MRVVRRALTLPGLRTLLKLLSNCKLIPPSLQTCFARRRRSARVHHCRLVQISVEGWTPRVDRMARMLGDECGPNVTRIKQMAGVVLFVEEMPVQVLFRRWFLFWRRLKSGHMTQNRNSIFCTATGPTLVTLGLGHLKFDPDRISIAFSFFHFE